MNNAVRMQVVQSVHQLLCDLANLILRQVPVVLKNFEKFTLCKLSDHAKLMCRLKAVEQQNDVFMVQPF